jgi:predicted phage terminase large subunit-like protein
VYQDPSRFKVVIAGRRFGKTRLAAFTLITKSIESPGVYWWTSPTWAVGTPAWRLIRRTLKNSLGDLVKITETTRTIELPNGSIIEFKSSDNPDSLRGEGLSGVVLDEVAQQKEEVWTDSLRAALADKQGWAVFIGTPSGKNWVYHLFEAAKRREGWAAFQFTSYQNPFIPAGEIDQSKLVMSSKSFAQEHLAQFITAGGSTFKREWFAQRGCTDEIIAKIISWDTAYGGKNSDFSACLVGGITSKYQLALLGGYRDRLEFPALQRQIESNARANINGLKWILIESKASGASLIQSIKETSPDLGNMLVAINPEGDKIRRADLVSVWPEKGMILLPKPSPDVPWLLPFEDDLFAFPSCEFKDYVDSFTQMLQFLSHYLSEGLRYRAAPEWEKLV